jgi:hypothetical protein
MPDDLRLRKQLGLFAYAKLAALITRGCRTLARDVVRDDRLREYCRARFGEAPAALARRGTR